MSLHFVAIVFIDLKKTFDTVDYTALTQKLEYYSVRGIAKDWGFHHIQTTESNNVGIKNYPSKTRKISAGVPQGSV